ncbi:MAG TPA: glycosyltransferase family 9 protein [Verrucomicrobiae bacterium]
MNNREKILIIRLSSIGDVLFTLPAVHAVRRNFPEAILYYLVAKEYAPLLRGFSEIDEVIVFDRSAFRSKDFPEACSELVRLIHELRKRKFSLVIDFQGYGETAWVSWLSGAPERWSSIYRQARGWACTRGAWRDNTIHPAQWNLSLLQQCGLSVSEIYNEYALPADAMAEARRFFSGNGLDETKPTLFIQPFTSSPGKNWPLDKFLALAWHFRPRWQVIFGGGPSERDALKPARDAGFVVSAGTPLLVSAGLIKLSTLAIGGDTGLLHIAVAMGRRIVMLMPRTGITPPFQHANWTVKPAVGKNIPDISVEEVIAACEQALS